MTTITVHLQDGKKLYYGVWSAVDGENFAKRIIKNGCRSSEGSETVYYSPHHVAKVTIPVIYDEHAALTHRDLEPIE